MNHKITVGTLLGGLALCGAACTCGAQVPNYSLDNLMTVMLPAAGLALTPNIGAELFSRFADWAGLRLRDRSAAAKNHDLRELLALSIEQVIVEVEREEVGTAKGRAFLSRIRGEVRSKLGEAAADTRFAAVWEAHVVEFFKPQLEHFADVKCMTPEAWTHFLNEHGYEMLDSEESHALMLSARALHLNLAKHVVGAFRESIQYHPTIYVAVQTSLLQECWKLLLAIKSTTEESTKQHAEILHAIMELREQIEKRDPEAFADALSELRVLGWSTDWLLRKQSDLLSEVARKQEHVASTIQSLAAAPYLASYLDHPWEHRRRLRFHFSLEDVNIHGNMAQRVVSDVLTEYLEHPDNGLWWLWTGLEGAGKSRLAMQCCKQAVAKGWNAGFISLDSLKALSNRWEDVRIDRDTLVVCDYVGLDASAARMVLHAADRHHRRCTGPGRHPKLRIILLERHSHAIVPTSAVNLPPQWCIELFQSHSCDAAYLERQYPRPEAASLHICEFTIDEARRFARECAQKCRGECGMGTVCDAPSPLTDDQVADRTIEILTDKASSSQLRPLHIRLVVFVLVALQHTALTFEEAITEYLRHRVELRRKEFRTLTHDDVGVDKLFNLVCVASLLRTIDIQRIPKHEHLPDEAFRVNPSRFLSRMGQCESDSVVQGLEPDLIGEWFVHLWCSPRSILGGQLPYSQLSAILDQIPGSNAGVSDFVQRTYRYPEFRDRGLWKRLRSRLGRYSTPFGRQFDKLEKRVYLLGGQTKEAEAHYSRCVSSAIQRCIAERGYVTLVDVMAGGSERCAQLLREYKDLKIIAIDRDTSRLAADNHRDRRRFITIEREIQGKISLGDILKRHNGGEPADIVVAKKALHELEWHQQVELIGEVGECLREKTGRCIIYADSPDFICAEGKRRARNILDAIRRDERTSGYQSHDWSDANVSQDMESEYERESSQRVCEFVSRQRFDPMSRSDAAVFANMWICLKDWANFNVHECINRYFSSANELVDAFANAGLTVDESTHGVSRFYMSLQAIRFVEDAINRLGYMCSDSTVTDDQLRGVFGANPRFGVFRKVVEQHLWCDNGPTAFGASEFIQAEQGQPFDLDDFVRGMDSRLGHIDFDEVPGSSFRMPVHVFSLVKSGDEEVVSGRSVSRRA